MKMSSREEFATKQKANILWRSFIKERANTNFLHQEVSSHLAPLINCQQVNVFPAEDAVFNAKATVHSIANFAHKKQDFLK